MKRGRNWHADKQQLNSQTEGKKRRETDKQADRLMIDVCIVEWADGYICSSMYTHIVHIYISTNAITSITLTINGIITIITVFIVLSSYYFCHCCSLLILQVLLKGPVISFLFKILSEIYIIFT